MKLTYYGHSCFLIETEGKKMLFDPFISGNPLIKDFDVNTIEADFILVSHAHDDHVADLVTIAKNTGAKVICAFEIMLWLNEKGIENVHPMNTGGGFNFDFGRVKCTVAQHSSGFGDRSYGGNPMGFVVTTKEATFYYSGDTALTMDMQLVPYWGKIDFALFPIGDNFTMDAKDAAIAADFVKTQKVIGLHYDTFGYIVINKDDAKKTFDNDKATLILPEIFETIDPLS